MIATFALAFSLSVGFICLLTPTANRSNELLTVKFRYKAPEADNSQLMEEVVMDKNVSLSKSSDNFRWSAATATFGMLLRNSEFKGEATYDQCKKLAAGARGKDTEGYRAEMIRMIESLGLKGHLLLAPK